MIETKYHPIIDDYLINLNFFITCRLLSIAFFIRLCKSSGSLHTTSYLLNYRD